MWRLAIQYGLWVFVGFIALLLPLHLVGLSTSPDLRVCKALLHFTLICYAGWNFLEPSPVGFKNLLEGADGIVSSLFGVSCFALFQLLYLKLRPNTLAILQSELTSGQFFASIKSVFINLTEGIRISLISPYLTIRIIDKRLAQAYSC